MKNFKITVKDLKNGEVEEFETDGFILCADNEAGVKNIIKTRLYNADLLHLFTAARYHAERYINAIFESGGDSDV